MYTNAHRTLDCYRKFCHLFSMPENIRSSALYRAFGRLLVKARESAGLTQDELSLKTERRVSRSAVANFETGRQRVALDQLYELALALGCSPSALLPDPQQLPTAAGVRGAGIPDDPSAARFVEGIVRPRRPVLGIRKDDVE